MRLGLRQSDTGEGADWRCHVSPRPAGRIYAAYALLVLVGCRTPARQPPHEEPLLNLAILHSLEPEMWVKEAPSIANPRGRVTEVYRLDMERSAAEQAVRQDPTVSLRIKETRNHSEYSAVYVVGGKRVRLGIYTGDGQHEVPPGQCMLSLNCN